MPQNLIAQQIYKKIFQKKSVKQNNCRLKSNLNINYKFMIILKTKPTQIN